MHYRSVPSNRENLIKNTVNGKARLSNVKCFLRPHKRTTLGVAQLRTVAMDFGYSIANVPMKELGTMQEEVIKLSSDLVPCWSR